MKGILKHMKNILLPSLVVAGVSLLPLYGKTPASTNKDAAFLRLAAQADMTTAHLGQLAQDRAIRDEIKNLAKTLVADHTSDYRQLTALSMQTGDAIPTAIDKANNREIEAIERYKGKMFDHEFVLNQTAEHEKLFKAFHYEADHGTNPDIKAYASKALPAIERHLHDVENLRKLLAAKS
jgi:putative membrane protein